MKSPRRRRATRAALAALVAALAIIAAVPLASAGQAVQPIHHTDARASSLSAAAQKAIAPVQQATDKLGQSTAGQSAQKVTSHASSPAGAAAPPAGGGTATPNAAPRQATADTQTTPPLHGTDPHGQGSVAVVDLNPSPTRPEAGDPTGKAQGEDVVLGRSRGEQNPDGTYHGHITILSVLGNEVLGVDTTPGQTQHGPLNALQTQVLDAICNGSSQQICLSVLTADSSTSANGSTNHFAVANADVGGPGGLALTAGESDGNISDDGTCQTSTGHSQVAGLKANGGPVADVAEATTTSKACQGQAPQQTNTSRVIGLGGTGLPIPAPGCANGTPDTVTGIPTLLPIVCNADSQNAQAAAPAGVREALDIFAVSAGSTSLLKTTAAASESHAVAPPAGPSTPGGHNGGGNNGGGNNGGNNNGGSNKPQCSDNRDNDGDGLVDYPADPGCTGPNDNSEAGNGKLGPSGRKHAPQCSDGRDNDGDGLTDYPADPGCTGPNDNSEAGGGGTGIQQANLSGGNGAGNGNQLPFTGVDIVALALAGFLAAGSGLALRRRLRLH